MIGPNWLECRMSRRGLCGAVFLALLASNSAVAQQSTGAVFLLVPVGGRAAALGQAAVADGGTSEAAFWNPAGLALMEGSEVAAHHAKTFISDNTALSAYFTAKGVGVIGVSAYLVDYGSQDVTNSGGSVSGKFSPKNVQLLASFATWVYEGLAFGVNYKLIQFRQDCSGDCGLFPSLVGTTHGVDVGLQYGRADAPLRFGVAIRHAGFSLQLEDRDQADPLPTKLDFGIAYRVMLPRPAPDVQALDVRFLVDIENDWGEFDDPQVRIGIELGYTDLIRLRTGYAFVGSDASGPGVGGPGVGGPAVGLGVKLGRFSVDFSRVFYDSDSFDEPVYISLRAGI